MCTIVLLGYVNSSIRITFYTILLVEPMYFVIAVQLNPADTSQRFRTSLKCRHRAFSIGSPAAVPVVLTD